ncbi:hypothetical protein [Fontivita pretiosa]|uniref:hypothetical protein n=1 Tax=Fontivita pretiosa TaxID=2989684 RepID=UPI003D163E13
MSETEVDLADLSGGATSGQAGGATLRTPGAPPRSAPVEGFVDHDGVEMYCIPGFDRMHPFLMTLASRGDLWMYVSSFGGLTAGRRDAEHCLFPYETEDRLHYAHGITGPLTIVRVTLPDGKKLLWEPFNHRAPRGGVSCRLYKTVLCDRILFEELHEGLDLAFSYEWSASLELGFVRHASITNLRVARPVKIELLDGLLNVMPPGVSLALQQGSSSLVDAHKRSEIDPQTGLAIYALSAHVHDRPEPAECLRANVIWSRGLPEGHRLLLSDQQVQAFRDGQQVSAENRVTGQRGAFLLASSFTLPPNHSISWDIVADVDLDHCAIERLRQLLSGGQGREIRSLIRQSTARSAEALARAIVAPADGLQQTADVISSRHHAANVLFNCMRGGVPVRGYSISRADLARFVRQRNAGACQRGRQWIDALPETIDLPQLLERAGIGDARPAAGIAEQGQVQPPDADADLRRLVLEYLPLTFARRHGDPSRPWNRFSIVTHQPDGSPVIRYEGNWRDIFQNWEALAMSFPELIESFIAKFVNASTIDGYNPYRITSDGIDWETLSPDDSNGTIGYWGDHQIVYLLRLLEASRSHHPGRLESLLGQAIFSYANVPYRIKPHAQIVRDPRSTIVFDRELDRLIAQRVQRLGADGKLVLRDPETDVLHVTLLEKLLVPLLAKLGGLVPGGGIWLNTQRPEWNDANNALAGYGLSVVTLCHLRRYVSFLLELLRPLAGQTVGISSEVVDWLNATGAVLLRHSDLLRLPRIDDRQRRRVMDDLGECFAAYRGRVYASGLSTPVNCQITEILPTLRLAISYLDYSIRANRRPNDGLYHSYNLLRLDHDARSGATASIRPLYQMLEGQVAALSSGIVSAEEAVEMLEAMFASPLWRQDQQSFMLYPPRELPVFLQINRIAEKDARAIPLLSAMLDAGDRAIVAADVSGWIHFNADFRNARDVAAALDRLDHDPRWRELAQLSRRAVLDLFERTFDHHAFTGRSGVMYAYEGIGSIYWHMVGKLLVAVQECFWRAAVEDESAAATAKLRSLYYRIRAGMGFGKPADRFGAFPTDPYSHTPAGGGARQPGMTGQVKEQILTRLGELGVSVEAGCVRFRPLLLRSGEFFTMPTAFQYIAGDGATRSIDLPAQSLAFTYCQTPIVYQLLPDAGQMRIRIVRCQGSAIERDGDTLDAASSQSLFRRASQIDRIEVLIPRQMIALD